jgi:hypothetical protein
MTKPILAIALLWAFAFLTTLALAMRPADAATDYTCVNACTKDGYSYGYCTSRCSYGNGNQQNQPPQNGPSRQSPYDTDTPNNRNNDNGGNARTSPYSAPKIDYTCMNNCQARGFLYQYCKERCAY